MSKTAQQVLDVARSFFGYREDNGSHKQIIDIYNNHKPLPVGYKVKYNDDWCDAFVTAVAIKADMVDLIGKECGVERHIQIFKQKGIWIEDGKIVPKVGDIITYNWNDNSQPNDGWADHIGFVEKVSGNEITTIEGNYSNSVRRRVLTVGSGDIRGYARPKYSTATVSKPSTPTQKSTGGIAMKELTTTTNNVQLRTAPSTTASVIAGLKKGSTVKFDNVVDGGGSVWGVQKRADGSKGYVELGKLVNGVDIK